MLLAVLKLLDLVLQLGILKKDLNFFVKKFIRSSPTIGELEKRSKLSKFGILWIWGSDLGSNFNFITLSPYMCHLSLYQLSCITSSPYMYHISFHQLSYITLSHITFHFSICPLSLYHLITLHVSPYYLSPYHFSFYQLSLITLSPQVWSPDPKHF